jgi:hypothetical protein
MKSLMKDGCKRSHGSDFKRRRVCNYLSLSRRRRTDSEANAFQDERRELVTPPQTSKSDPRGGSRVTLTTLKQACSSEYQGAQDAFKDSMIH